VNPFQSIALVASIIAFSGFAASAQNYSDDEVQAYIKAKNWQGLIQYATAATQADPSNAKAWVCLGQTYGIDLGEWDKAVDPIKKFLALQPSSAPGWHALGVSYIQLKQYSDAVAAIKHATQINPNQPTYWNNLAVAYSDAGAFNSAAAALDKEQALAQRLDNMKVWYTLGNGYAKLQEPQKAIPAFLQAVQLDPNFAQAWTNLGAMYEFAGDNEKAMRAYNQGQALGDPLGGQDASQLQAEIQAAKEAASSSPVYSAAMGEHILYIQRLDRIAHGSDEM
jgi:tetratricopeptide (TPR) repeat protein